MSKTDSLFERILRGRQGKNIGLPTGLEKTDNITYGIQKQYVYTIFADSGSGKSSYTLYSFVYKPITQSKYDVNILYFSFEMSEQVLLAKLLTMYIYETYKKVVRYDEVLSLNEIVDDEKFKLICDSKSWLETIEKKLTIIDTPITPAQMDKCLREWNEMYGRFISMSSHNEQYIKKDQEAYNLVIIDHVKLAKDNGKGTKATIDDEAALAIYYRNKCDNIFVMVQQANRNFKNMERRTSGYQLLEMNDMSDSSGPAQASEVVIGLFNPFREKLMKLEGYNFKAMGDRVRILQVLKNRFGQSDKNVVLNFWGEINLFKEAPEPEEITDYEELLRLEGIEPEVQQAETEPEVSFNFNNFKI
jgi:DnaB-like helicase C terminal domain